LRDLILQRLLRFLRLRRSVPGTSWLLLSLSRPAGLCSAIRRFLRLSFAAGLRSHIAAPDPPHQIFLSLLSEALHPQEQDQQGCARQDLSTDHPHTEGIYPALFIEILCSLLCISHCSQRLLPFPCRGIPL